MKGVIMKKMALPKIDPKKYLMADVPTYIKKEWVIDNTYLERLRPEVAQELVRTRLEYLSENAKIEAMQYEKMANILK
jgi:hypothetical protein